MYYSIIIIVYKIEKRKANKSVPLYDERKITTQTNQ